MVINMKYKLSKYNYSVQDGEGFRLFNSVNGMYSLLYISPEKFQIVEEIKNDIENEKWKHDPIFNLLVERGFIIPETTDEEVLVNYKLNNAINNSTLFLIIMPTEKCNFNCKYCYETHTKGRMDDDIQNAIVKFVEKNIKYYTQLSVAWFGGEPLEEIDIIEHLSNSFLKICKTARKRYQASITTNGYNLTRDVFLKLLSLNVFEYQITIDGDQNIHDKFRVLANGDGTYQHIIENLKEIKKIKRKTFNITIRSNFSKELYENLDNYIAILDDMIGDDPRFSVSVHQIGNWGGENVENIKNSIIEFSGYKEIIKKILELKPKISFDSHLIDLDLHTAICYASRKNEFVIGPDGCIYKCTEDFDNPLNNVGSLDTKGNINIDEGKVALWMGLSPSENSNCAIKCKYYGCCMGRTCPKINIVNLSENNKISSCSRIATAVPELLLLIKKEHFSVV